MPKKIDHQDYADKTIALINNFQHEDNKKLAAENIRALYRETSAYSLHYSNIRSALAVLFIGGAIAFLPDIFSDKSALYPLKYLELIFLFIGFLTHIALTRNAQSAIMHLVAIERILSSIFIKEETNVVIIEEEPAKKKKHQTIWYFSYWAEGLGDKKKLPFCECECEGWFFYVIREPFTQLYAAIIFSIFMFTIFI